MIAIQLNNQVKRSHSPPNYPRISEPLTAYLGGDFFPTRESRVRRQHERHVVELNIQLHLVVQAGLQELVHTTAETLAVLLASVQEEWGNWGVSFTVG